MNQRRILTGFLNAALHQKHGVAIWFMPGQREIKAILSGTDEIKTPTHFKDVSEEKGFVFAPFVQDHQQKILFLKPGQVLNGYRELSRIECDQYDTSTAKLPHKITATTRQEHISNCREIIIKIKKGDAEKVVLSRIKSVNSIQHPADILLQMKREYPDAFCYLFFTPQTGLWMGATPETLIHSGAGKIRTMALAGTRKHEPDKPPDIPWPEKEQQEQQYVTGFIRHKLGDLGAGEISVSEPYTVQAGSIEHIRTDFVIDSENTGVKTGEIVEALHPTPAICGQPREAALQLIRQTEKHNREYYTGYLGPVNFDGITSVFVNLRCMKKTGEKFLIFAGGGITADSDPESEWDETEIKAAVMEKVLNKA